MWPLQHLMLGIIQGVRKKKVSYTMPIFTIKDFLTLPPSPYY